MLTLKNPLQSTDTGLPFSSYIPNNTYNSKEKFVNLLLKTGISPTGISKCERANKLLSISLHTKGTRPHSLCIQPNYF